MSKFWRILLQKKKIIVSFFVVVFLWALAAADRFGDIFAWETFLTEISKNEENEEDDVRELFEKCQGEGIMEYYEGMGSSFSKKDHYREDIKLWIEKMVKESFPNEEWTLKEYPKDGTKEIHIENKKQTISGKVRVYKNKIEDNDKQYLHFVFYSNGTEDSLFALEQVWSEKMKVENIMDYKDYYYRTLCFQGKLTKREQKQTAKQYCQFFGVNKRKESMIEGMVNVYGFTEKIQNSTIVDCEKINFHIAFVYDESEDKTRIYLATPFLNVDY